MKIFLPFLLFLCCIQVTYGQGSTASEYYQYQRNENFRKYMENVSSKGLAGTLNTKYDYTIDKNAINDMVSMWERRNGKKSVEELERDRQAQHELWKQKERDKIALDLANSNYWHEAKAREAWADKEFVKYASYYTKLGFELIDAIVMSNNCFKDVTTKGQTTVEEVFNERNERAEQALKKYKKIENTGSFEELILLIGEFDIAAITANEALEKLKNRFPEKKNHIDLLIPFHVSNYWKYLGIRYVGYTKYWSGYSASLEERRNNMNTLLKNWLKANPYVITFLLSGSWDEINGINFFIDDISRNNDAELLKLLLLSSAMYDTSKIEYINRKLFYSSDLKIDKIDFTVEEIEYAAKESGKTPFTIIQNLTVKNLNLGGSAKGFDKEELRYVHLLKVFAEKGDLESMLCYGKIIAAKLTDEKPDVGYNYIKKTLDAGLLINVQYYAATGEYKKIPVDDWGAYISELEFKHNKTHVLIDKNHTGYTKAGKLIIEPDDNTQSPRIYYYGEVWNGKAYGNGEGKDKKYIYSGQWKDNKYHGEGTIYNIYDGNDYYQGTFYEGKKHGAIKLFEYEGHYVHGKKVSPKGYKKLEYKEETTGYHIKYLGEIKNGMPHGFGEAKIYKNPNGDLLSSYQGFWNNGKYEGLGVMSGNSPIQYVGEWKNGSQNGFGFGKNIYNIKYIGQWENGLPNGEGLTNVREFVFQGNYFDGVLMEKSRSKTKLSPTDNASFSDIITAISKLEWKNLETTILNNNYFQTISNDKLYFKKYDDSYSMSYATLNQKKIDNYSYEATFTTISDSTISKNHSVGLLLNLIDDKGKNSSYLFFTINPHNRQFSFSSYDSENYKSIYYSMPGTNYAYVNTDKLSYGKEQSTNKLKIEKSGDKIHLYINDGKVLTHTIDNQTQHFNTLNGIGISIKGYNNTGYLDAIKFTEN